MKQIAEQMQVKPSTVTSMMQNLHSGGFIRYESRKGCQLTRKGSQAALSLVRKHRIIETFLVEVLEMDWAVVHAEAERLEHVISARVLDAMDRVLEYPSQDPHGAGIPDRDGKLEPESRLSLRDCAEGFSGKISHVQDEDEGFLRYLKKQNILPGNSFLVKRRDEYGRSLHLQTEGKGALNLSFETAGHIFVIS